MSTTHTVTPVKVGQVRWDQSIKLLYIILRLSTEPRKYGTSNWYVVMNLNKTFTFDPLELEEFCETDILSDEVFDEPS